MIAWRAYLIGLAVLILAGAGWYVARLQDKAAQLAETREQLASVRREFATWRADAERRQQEQDAATRGYLDELAKLRVDIERRPVPAVRLCPQPALPLPATEAAARSAETTAAVAGLVPPAAADPGGRDIGPGLERIVSRCEEVSAQLRAVLDYLE